MIGRDKERKELEKLYNSNKAEMVAIYGQVFWGAQNY